MDDTAFGLELDRLALAELLEFLPDAFLCLDEQCQLLYQNTVARRLFSPEAGVAMESHASAPLFAEMLAQLRLNPGGGEESSESQVQTVELRSPNGRRGVWEVSWGQRDLVGRRVWLLLLREVRRHHQIQDAVYQAQKRQVIGSLAAGIAHDFNNILTAVIANIDLVFGEESLSAQARMFLQRAQASARRGAEINGKLLAFSRHAETRRAPLDLVKLAEEALFILRRGLEKRIEIKFTPPAGLWQILADPSQIVQVLMNLCLNARDAMPRGGTLTVEMANTTFAAASVAPRHPGEFVRVSVSDTGTGMPPEVLKRLFEPYFTTKEYGKGAGLSLSIAAHVLAEHGGWMEAESVLGQGSRFHVFLPRCLPRDQEAVTIAEVGCEAPPAALEGAETILVADDEPSVRTVVRAILQFRGYHVLEAAAGHEALEQFQRNLDLVDLVLLDVDMPGLDGWDTLAHLRKLSSGVPVLMLSGGNSGSWEQKLSELGAGGLIEKPFKNQELLRAVRTALDEGKRSGG
jgi:two-component system, cell cycle sensor histidine kinase and response regulator CckA